MKNAISSSLIPYGIKKNEMREHYTDNHQIGSFAPLYKISRKKFLPTYYNYLVFNSNLFMPSRWLCILFDWGEYYLLLNSEIIDLENQFIIEKTNSI